MKDFVTLINEHKAHKYVESVIFAGKGGVGKSTSAAAYSLHQSRKGLITLIDYDGGHSSQRVLGINQQEHSASAPNLRVEIIDMLKFMSIADAKRSGVSTEAYLAQFKDDHGLLPFCDMITAFFGAPTDVSSVSRFATLCQFYQEALSNGTKDVVIDVEPTAGLERLLNSTEAITRSMRNLQKTGWLTLKTIGTKWPDIAAYLRSEYVKAADKHASRIEFASKAVQAAKYFLVCTPENGPVDEMQNVAKIIASYHGRVIGYVINNIRGESYEPEQIARVKQISGPLPVVEVPHDLRLCDSDASHRKKALLEVGERFAVKKFYRKVD